MNGMTMYMFMVFFIMSDMLSPIRLAETAVVKSITQ